MEGNKKAVTAAAAQIDTGDDKSSLSLSMKDLELNVSELSAYLTSGIHKGKELDFSLVCVFVDTGNCRALLQDRSILFGAITGPEKDNLSGFVR
jgi:hypothetical protein